MKKIIKMKKQKTNKKLQKISDDLKKKILLDYDVSVEKHLPILDKFKKLETRQLFKEKMVERLTNIDFLKSLDLENKNEKNLDEIQKKVCAVLVMIYSECLESEKKQLKP